MVNQMRQMMNNPRNTCLSWQGGDYMDVHDSVTGTLKTQNSHYVLDVHQPDARIKLSDTDTFQTLTRRMGTGGNNTPMVLEQQAYHIRITSEFSSTDRLRVASADISPTLDTGSSNITRNQGGLAILTKKNPVYTTSKNSYHTSATEDTASTLVASDYKDPPTVMASPEFRVRRITPLECERLQGFPDNWTRIGTPTEKDVADYEFEYNDEGNVINKTQVGTHTETVYMYEYDGKQKLTSDTARYKALGNSIALPFWKVLARRISAQYDRDITMASLFDGIGGFPLAFEHCGGKAVWASEIEEFPIAVTKQRFPEKDDD